MQKGLKDKFACKSCSLGFLEGSKIVEGDFVVKSLFSKTDEKELVHLTSVEQVEFNYDNIQSKQKESF